MSKNLLIGAGVFLAVVVIGLFLVGGKPKNVPVSSSTPTPLNTNTEAVNVEENFREVSVSGNEYSYNPASIDLAKGEKIRLTFTNVGNMPHNLMIDELGVSTKTIARGKSDTVEFVVDKSGTFKFYCNIGNHRDLGMEGEVEVK